MKGCAHVRSETIREAPAQLLLMGMTMTAAPNAACGAGFAGHRGGPGTAQLERSQDWLRPMWTRPGRSCADQGRRIFRASWSAQLSAIPLVFLPAAIRWQRDHTVAGLQLSAAAVHPTPRSAGVKAATLSLKDAREQVALDASTAYIELDTVNANWKLRASRRNSARQACAN